MPVLSLVKHAKIIINQLVFLATALPSSAIMNVSRVQALQIVLLALNQTGLSVQRALMVLVLRLIILVFKVVQPIVYRVKVQQFVLYVSKATQPILMVCAFLAFQLVEDALDRSRLFA